MTGGGLKWRRQWSGWSKASTVMGKWQSGESALLISRKVCLRTERLTENEFVFIVYSCLSESRRWK